MNKKQAFKTGFVKELGDRGMAPDVLESVLCKSAEGSNLDAILKAVGAAGRTALKGLAVPALGLPFYLGWQLAKTKRVNPSDVRALSDVELIKDYASGAHALQRSIGRDKPKREEEGKKVAAAAPPFPQPPAVTLTAPAPPRAQQDLSTRIKELRTRLRQAGSA